MPATLKYRRADPRDVALRDRSTPRWDLEAFTRFQKRRRHDEESLKSLEIGAAVRRALSTATRSMTS